MKKLSLSLLLFLGTSYVSAAEMNLHKNIYVGVGGSFMATGSRDDVNVFKTQDSQERAVGATLIVGYSIRSFLDIEARYSQSVSDDDEFEQKIWGVYLKPKYELFNNFSIYGLYGVGGVDISPNSSNEDFSVTDMSFGAGIKYKITPNISLFADYIDNARHNYEEFDGEMQQVDTRSLTTGVIYNF